LQNVSGKHRNTAYVHMHVCNDSRKGSGFAEKFVNSWLLDFPCICSIPKPGKLYLPNGYKIHVPNGYKTVLLSTPKFSSVVQMYILAMRHFCQHGKWPKLP
jgi:hypothetical protein